MVLGLLVISYASSVRAYLAQRAQISGVRTAIAQRREDIATAQATIVRWSDPAAVEIAARERFALVLPGDQLYYVVDDPGSTPAAARVRAPSVGGAPVPVPGASTWWSRVAGSVGAAANTRTTPVTSAAPPRSASGSAARTHPGSVEAGPGAGPVTTGRRARSAGVAPSDR